MVATRHRKGHKIYIFKAVFGALARFPRASRSPMWREGWLEALLYKSFPL